MPEKAEDADMAVRRLGFYARCGAWDTHYTEHLFDAWFRILVLDCPGCSSLGPGDCGRGTGRLLPPHHQPDPVAKARSVLCPGRQRVRVTKPSDAQGAEEASMSEFHT